jgi:hypothetical protein
VPVQIGPKAHPAYYTMGTECFSGAKRPDRGTDHPLHSSAEAANGLELYLCPPFYANIGMLWGDLYLYRPWIRKSELLWNV